MPDKEYCCYRFQESVEEGIFCNSDDSDETEWYMPEWLHIYYCPFCGTLIKGNGYGKFHKEMNKNQEG